MGHASVGLETEFTLDASLDAPIQRWCLDRQIGSKTARSLCRRKMSKIPLMQPLFEAGSSASVGVSGFSRAPCCILTCLRATARKHRDRLLAGKGSHDQHCYASRSCPAPSAAVCRILAVVGLATILRRFGLTHFKLPASADWRCWLAMQGVVRSP